MSLGVREIVYFYLVSRWFMRWREGPFGSSNPAQRCLVEVLMFLQIKAIKSLLPHQLLTERINNYNMLEENSKSFQDSYTHTPTTTNPPTPTDHQPIVLQQTGPVVSENAGKLFKKLSSLSIN